MCGHNHTAALQPRSEHSCCAGNGKHQGAPAPAEGRHVAVTEQPSGLSYWRRLLRKMWTPDREPASRRA
jgi:hypothetical protein